MKTEEEILRFAIDSDQMLHAGMLCEQMHLVQMDGMLYPFNGTKLVNPLDIYNILRACPRNFQYMDYVVRILDSFVEATKHRDAGYEIITRSASQAPKVIKRGERVYILGDEVKRLSLSMPYLSTQLADEKWEQSKVEPWSSLGFTNPKKVPVRLLSRKESKHGANGQFEKTRWIYGVDWDMTVTIEKDDFGNGVDWTFGAQFATRSVPNNVISRPTYVWEEKGAQDD